MNARELWETLGRPWTHHATGDAFAWDTPKAERDRMAAERSAAFWSATEPPEGRCRALPARAWDEMRGAQGPWCRYPMPCGHHKPKPPKPPKPVVVRRSKEEVERENAILRRRLGLLLAADACATLTEGTV